MSRQPVTRDEKAERYDLPNDYTQMVLAETAEVARRLREGLTLSVSADSDVVLDRPDWHWVGIRLRTAWTDPRWEAWRGSLFGDGEVTIWPTLAAAVEFYATKVAGAVDA